MTVGTPKDEVIPPRPPPAESGVWPPAPDVPDPPPPPDLPPDPPDPPPDPVEPASAKRKRKGKS